MAQLPLNGATLGFEETLWATADQMRGHMDPAEYKHVVLGLVFLKYISDSFSERYEQLRLWTADPEHNYYVRDERVRYEVMEDRDEYRAENIFWVPAQARWQHIQDNANTTPQRAEKDCDYPRCPRRQNRTQPPDEPHSRSHRPRHFQVAVRGL